MIVEILQVKVAQLRMFVWTISNIDFFFLKILPLKDDELVSLDDKLYGLNGPIKRI